MIADVAFLMFVLMCAGVLFIAAVAAVLAIALIIYLATGVHIIKWLAEGEKN